MNKMSGEECAHLARWRGFGLASHHHACERMGMYAELPSAVWGFCYPTLCFCQCMESFRQSMQSFRSACRVSITAWGASAGHAKLPQGMQSFRQRVQSFRSSTLHIWHPMCLRCVSWRANTRVRSYAMRLRCSSRCVSARANTSSTTLHFVAGEHAGSPLHDVSTLLFTVLFGAGEYEDHPATSMCR
jgi:hypothetical protein